MQALIPDNGVVELALSDNGRVKLLQGLVLVVHDAEHVHTIALNGLNRVAVKRQTVQVLARVELFNFG